MLHEHNVMATVTLDFGEGQIRGALAFLEGQRGGGWEAGFIQLSTITFTTWSA